MHGYGMMTGMGWLGILSMVLFWGGLLLLFIWGMLSLLNRSRATEPDAIEIVRQRYARGEISSDEYRQVVETLGSH